MIFESTKVAWMLVFSDIEISSNFMVDGLVWRVHETMSKIDSKMSYMSSTTNWKSSLDLVETSTDTFVVTWKSLEVTDEAV